jgi:hypothetical protein
MNERFNTQRELQCPKKFKHSLRCEFGSLAAFPRNSPQLAPMEMSLGSKISSVQTFEYVTSRDGRTVF